MKSLRRELLVSLLGAIVAVFLVGGIATYGMARVEIDEVMDYHLRQFALSLRDQSFGQPSAPIVAPEEAFDIVIQIWDGHGLRLYLSHPHTVLPDRAQFGYTTVATSEGSWRVFSVPLHDRVIQVAQPMRVRSGMAAGAALRTLSPLLLILPLMGFMIWYLVGRGLRPLDRLAGAVRSRRPEAMAPLSSKDVPTEAQPLVESLNGLLGRLDHALAAQRAFVADAAHELRTPLTALQLQLQLTERAHDETERKAALAELRQGLQRAIHLVQQLLTLARQEPDGATRQARETVSLADVTRSVMAEHAPMADAGRIDLGATALDDGITVQADPAALRTLLGNLIDNAIRYTPPDGRVNIAVREAGGRAWLEVSDTGPGIAPTERERVLDRFYRHPGQEQPGSGLGLAIVKAIADRHGAELQLDASDCGGLRVRVGFRTERSRGEG